MRPHYIKPNKRNTNPRYIVFYDTETQTKNVNNVKLEMLKLGVLRYVQLRSKDKIYEEWRTFRTPGEFWDYIDGRAPKRGRLWLISHNQHFDFNVLGGFKYLSALNYKIEKMIVENDVFIVKASKDRKTLLFLDTLNYVKAPLEDLGKAIGLEKLKIDFSKASDAELEHYCRRDVEILSEWFLRLFRWFKENNLGNFGLTVSQLAFNTFKHVFMKHKILAHHNPEITELEKESYRGGRNECFYIGKAYGVFHKLDVNSMYPFVMAYNNYPTKPVKILNNPSPQTLRNYLDYYTAVARVNIEIDEPAIGVKKDKLIFPIGRFTATLTTPELWYVYKYGKVHRVDKAVIYKSAQVFYHYINYFYKLKLDADKRGDKITRQFAKLLMNSLYGKFAQQVRELEPVDYPAPTEWGAEIFIDAETKERFKVYYIAGKAYVLSKQHKLFSDAQVAIAAHVTAYARMLLWDLIKWADPENVYYCDTDSLITNDEGYKKLKSYIGDDLGQLKHEGTANYIEIRALKDYVFGIEEKKKGIRKTDIMIDTNTYVQERFMKTKTQLSKGILEGVAHQTITKHLNYVYDKGIVQPNGRVKPIQLNEQ